MQLERYVSELARSLHISPEHWYGVTSNQKAVYIVTVIRIYSTTVRESRRETKYTNTHAQKLRGNWAKKYIRSFQESFSFLVSVKNNTLHEVGCTLISFVHIGHSTRQVVSSDVPKKMRLLIQTM